MSVLVRRSWKMVGNSCVLQVIFGALFLCVVISGEVPKISDQCKIPNQKPEIGKCVLPENCPQYQDLKQSLPLTIEKISFIRRVQCDTSGQICCPIEGDYQNPSIAINMSLVKPPSANEHVGNRLGGNDDEDECGFITTTRIIGGEIAGLEDYPWTSLLIYNSTSSPYGCNGALIRKNYVLTAAHCVTGPDIALKGDLIKVRLGEFNTQTNPDCIQEIDYYNCADEAVDIEVDKVIIHPYYDYNSRSKQHDLALIKLKQAANYSQYIYPICLPSSSLPSNLSSGATLELAGWGQTNFFSSRFGNIISPLKLFLKVPVVEHSKCQSVFRGLNLDLGMGQLCAGGEKDRDSCPGDSGGPLMYFNHKANRYVCSGIVSLGKGEKGKLACGAEGFPGIYTNTQHYVDWITNAIKHN